MPGDWKSTKRAFGSLTGVHIAKNLAPVLNLTLKMTMKPLNWLLSGLLLLLSASQPTAEAAAAKSAKSTAASPADKSARSKSISRDPWLGAIVVDAATGKVLYENQADAKGYPASVLKLMDLLIILEKIEQKQLSLAGPGSRERQSLAYWWFTGVAGREGIFHR